MIIINERKSMGVLNDLRDKTEKNYEKGKNAVKEGARKAADKIEEFTRDDK